MERLAAIQVVHVRDVLAIATSILHALDTLRPIPVPGAPVPSNELAGLLDKREPAIVPSHMGAEFALYDEALMRRARARSENERRLATVLWAEQCLRAAGDSGHETLHRFARAHYGMTEPASADCSERWRQAHPDTLR